MPSHDRGDETFAAIPAADPEPVLEMSADERHDVALGHGECVAAPAAVVGTDDEQRVSGGGAATLGAGGGAQVQPVHATLPAGGHRVPPAVAAPAPTPTPGPGAALGARPQRSRKHVSVRLPARRRLVRVLRGRQDAEGQA